MLSELPPPVVICPCVAGWSYLEKQTQPINSHKSKLACLDDNIGQVSMMAMLTLTFKKNVNNVFLCVKDSI